MKTDFSEVIGHTEL